MKIEVQKVGDSIGLILPPAVISRLNATSGNWIDLTESNDGSFYLSSHALNSESRIKLLEGQADNS